MKVILTLIIFWGFFSGQAKAQDLPADFAYQVPFETQVPDVKSQIMFDKIFQDQDFIPLKAAFLTAGSTSGIDQIYTNSTMTKSVFIKYGVRPRGKSYLNRVLPHPEGFLFHFQTPDQVPVAVFFHNVSKTMMNQIIAVVKRDLSKQKEVVGSSAKLKFAEKYFLSEAQAAQVCLPTDPVKTGMAPLAAISAKVKTNDVTRAVGSCIVEAWNGLANSTLRKAANIGTFLEDMVKKPQEAWGNVVNGFNQLVHFAKNFRTEMTKAWAGASQLASELDEEIICAFLGEIGPDVILMLAGGVAVAKVTMAIAEYGQRLAMVRKFLTYIAKAKSVNPSEGLPAGFLKRLIRGEISPAQLQTIDRLTENNVPFLARGAASCAP